jgi:GntR family transcriptional regulator
MGEKFDANQPIYLQIVQKAIRQIVRGDLKPGDKLKSVREMAVEYGVNPNTVQRVNSELERMGIIEARRGQGMFVTDDEERLTMLRTELMDGQITQFVRDMRETGFSDEEIVEGVKRYLGLEQH